jgi:hypothetical protein
VELLQAVSQCYRYLAGWEENEKRRLAMMQRRMEVLHCTIYYMMQRRMEVQYIL